MIFIRINRKRPAFLMPWTGYRIVKYSTAWTVTVSIMRWGGTVGWKANE